MSPASAYLDCMDPELVSAYRPKMGTLLDLMCTDVRRAREAFAAAAASRALSRSSWPGEKRTTKIAGLENDPEVTVVAYREEPAEFPDCALIWLHGGGYLAGSADDSAAQAFSKVLPVFSVDYRLAPESRAPAAVRDVCAVIDWLGESQAPRKILLAGAGAGAGVAASAALFNRDRGGPELAWQLLVCAMLDDLHDTPSGHMEIPEGFRNRSHCLHGWSLYVEEGGASPYAAAMRAQDLSRLPPAYILAGAVDLFCDEDVRYAERLRHAGIPAELVVYPGAPHGFDRLAPDAAVSRRAKAACHSALRHVLARNDRSATERT